MCWFAEVEVYALSLSAPVTIGVAAAGTLIFNLIDRCAVRSRFLWLIAHSFHIAVES